MTGYHILAWSVCWCFVTSRPYIVPSEKLDDKHREIEDVRREYITVKRDVQYEGTLYEVAKDVKGVDMEDKIHIPKKIEKI